MNWYYFNRIFFGLLLIGAGVLFLMNRIYGYDLDMAYLCSTYWPLIIIYFGLAGVVQQSRWSRGSHGVIWHLIWIAVGLYFLGHNLELIDLTFGEMVMYIIPGVLIVLGLNMILRPKAYVEREKAKHMQKEEWKRQKAEWKQQWKQQRYEWKQNRHTWKEQRRATYRAHHEPNATEDVDLQRLEQEPDFIKEEQMKERHQTVPQQPESAGNQHGFEPLQAKQRATAPPPRPERPGHKWDDAHSRNYGGFIGDLYLGEDVWELENMNISHFIGDTVLDLTKAEVPYGETRLNISSFIGDIKVFVPNDMELEVMVVSSSFLGDKTILDHHEGGLFKHFTHKLPTYELSDKRLRIVASQFIGDLLIQRVG